jgi:hypothetical protein
VSAPNLPSQAKQSKSETGAPKSPELLVDHHDSNEIGVGAKSDSNEEAMFNLREGTRLSGSGSAAASSLLKSSRLLRASILLGFFSAFVLVALDKFCFL